MKTKFEWEVVLITKVIDGQEEVLPVAQFVGQGDAAYSALALESLFRKEGLSRRYKVRKIGGRK